jgi:hypothetical protein
MKIIPTDITNKGFTSIEFIDNLYNCFKKDTEIFF